VIGDSISCILLVFGVNNVTREFSPPVAREFPPPPGDILRDYY